MELSPPSFMTISHLLLFDLNYQFVILFYFRKTMPTTITSGNIKYHYASLAYNPIFRNSIEVF